MEKYVYKITNKINGKIYIGQTPNVQARFEKHCRFGPISSDIKKYGKENFTVEVLYFGEDYNNIEKRYIEELKSNDSNIGYNTRPGGGYSEELIRSPLSENDIVNIKNDLAYTSLSMKDIANKYNVSVDIIYNINNGESHCSIFEKYPIRFNKTTYIKSHIYEIYDDLKSSLTIEEICSKHNIERWVLLNINKGKTYRQNNVSYPIREMFLPKEIRDKIIDLLENTSLTGTEIVKMFDPSIVNLSTIYNLNSGKSWKDPNRKYPIRDLTHNSSIRNF